MEINIPSPISDVVLLIGMVLVSIGAVCDLLASIGLLRFRNFFLRMHAATVGIIGGAVVPLIGVGLIALSLNAFGSFTLPFTLLSIATASFIMVVAPIATHALANAAYRASTPKPEPLIYDAIKEEGDGS
ncbi:MAG TPA: cation:proton antiporter [Acidilobales archaeon]|nr:cation:proton antiporter [Acidilobales archaeon]